MSTLGKILVGLNLVLAAAFFGWAANATKTNQKWREQFLSRDTDLVKEKAERIAEVDKLRAEKLAFEKDVARLTSENANAANAKERVEGELREAQSSLNKLNLDVTNFATTLQGIEASKSTLQSEKDKAEKAQRDAETAKTDAEAKRDDAEKLASDLKAKLDDANNSIAELEKDKTTKEKKIASLETELDTLAANTNAKVTDFKPMPEITAAVLDVSTAVEPGLIALNAGANKGVKRGFTFEIFEGKTYKGQARVEFVHPEMSSAVIVNKVQGQTIRQGDSAMTRL